MKRVAIGIIGILVLLGAGWYGFIRLSSGQSEANTSTYQMEKAQIAALFKNHSPQDAYVEFKVDNKKRSQQVQHLDAHLVGEQLYETVGINGFTICDGTFGFGCFHGFLGSAIADRGVSVVPELDAACVQAYGVQGLGCSHGIGHGLVSYFGYNTADILKSLDMCSTLSWGKPYGGCRDGVFMEYTFRTMETEGNNRTREFSSTTKYEPCKSVPSDSEESCYFSLPAWWSDVLRSESKRFVDVSTYCHGVPGAANITSCFRGIGYAEAPIVSFSYDAGIQQCDTYQGTSRLWCREGLAWAFYADPDLRDHVPQICTEGLSASDAKKCIDEYLFVLK